MADIELLVALVSIVAVLAFVVWRLRRVRAAEVTSTPLPLPSLPRAAPPTPPTAPTTESFELLPSELLVTDLSLPRIASPDDVPSPRPGFVPPPVPMQFSKVATLLGMPPTRGGVDDDAEDFRATIQLGKEAFPAVLIPASMRARVGEGALGVTHIGETFTLGMGSDFYGIWYRRLPGGAVKRFPRNPEGWCDAWAAFEELEPQSQSAS